MNIDSALYAREVEKFRPYIPELGRGAEPTEMMAMDTSSIGGYSSSSSEVSDSDSDASGGDSLDAPPPPPTRGPPPSRSPSSAGPAMPSNLTDNERARWRMLTDEERGHPSILDLISMDNKARERLFDAYTAFVATSGKIRRTMEQAAAIVMKCFRKKKNFRYIHSRIDEGRVGSLPKVVPASRVSRSSGPTSLSDPFLFYDDPALTRDSALPPLKNCSLKGKRAKVHLHLRLKSPSSEERGQLSKDRSPDHRTTLPPLLLRSAKSLGPGLHRLLRVLYSVQIGPGPHQPLRVQCRVRTGPSHLPLLLELACSRPGPGHPLLRHVLCHDPFLPPPVLQVNPWNSPTSSSEPSRQSSAQL